MKSIIVFSTLLMVSLSASAETILTCKGLGEGGSLIKQIIVNHDGKSLTVQAESYMGEGLTDVKILKKTSTPVSMKLQLDVNIGGKASLVMQKKRAVMLYEANEGDDVSTGATVEFLSCK